MRRAIHNLVYLVAIALTWSAVRGSFAEEAADPLAAWTGEVAVHAVLKDAERHSIHAYFNTSPESPDGRHVLLYTSTTADGHTGEIWIVERSSGEATVLARNVEVEDAHRAACQQWLSGGRTVVFHDRRDGRWVVVGINVETRQERILAQDRQVAWGQPAGNVIPLYGPHWNPGSHRDLELLNVETHEIRTALKADDVQAAHAKWIGERFGSKRISIFFPIISPDESLAVFKLAAPEGGDFRSAKASHRDGLFCCDLNSGEVLWMHAHWGHPAWHPDSASLINYDRQGLFTIDARTGAVRRASNLPAFPGSHPSFGPGGRLFATDLRLGKSDGALDEWAAVVGSLAAGRHRIVHRFENGRGSTSWRESHPHPVFSQDGRRLYFNVSADRWTRLYVAEVAASN